MPSPKTHGAALAWGSRTLRAAGIESATLDSRVLLSYALGKESRALESDAPIPPPACKKFTKSIARRAAREPVAYITGTKEFWKYSFKVGPETLIPRPDSETLIEAVLGECAGAQTMLDLGTGTGCLLLSLLGEYPRANGVGLDICLSAVDTARSNARALKLAARAKFLNASWSDAAPPASIAKTKFDIAVSNPPYIAAAELQTLEVAKYEPALALDGGADGLGCYREIAAALNRWDLLAPGARIFLEIGHDQSSLVEKIFASEGFAPLKSFRDLVGTLRVLEFAN